MSPDRKIPEIIIGKGQNMALDYLLQAYEWHNPDRRLYQEDHRYYPVWVEFQKWCTENELESGFVYGQDGGGIESWHTLVVKPA